MLFASRTFTYGTTYTTQSLSITLDKPSFFVDEYIQGKVQLNIQSQIIINDINISLNQIENWKTKNDNYAVIAETINEYLISMNLDIKRQLKMTTNLISLRPGTFVFPFYFKIPKAVQPCFENPETENLAFIRYYLTAQLVSPYVQSSSSTFLLLKSRPVLESKQLLFTNSTNLRKWGLFSAGETCLSVSIVNGSDNFKNGTTIDLNIDIDNNKGKLATDECKITLVRNITLKSKIGQVKKELKKNCISKTIKTVVSTKNKNNFTASISLADMETSQFDFKTNKLPYTNITDMSYFLPSINSLIIKCSYSLEVVLSFESFVKQDDKPKVSIPITICHQSPIEYNAEIQSYYEKQNLMNSQYNNSQYNNQYNNSQYNNQCNNSQYNNQYNNSQYNNQYNNNQYNNNNNSINQSNVQIPNNGNMDLTNSYQKPSLPNSYQKPLPPEENNFNEVNYDNDLPTQEEIEKPTQDNNNNNINDNNNDIDDTSDAPAPAFPPNP